MRDSAVESVTGVALLVVVSVAGGTVAEVSESGTAGAGSFIVPGIAPGGGCGSVLGVTGSVIVGWVAVCAYAMCPPCATAHTAHAPSRTFDIGCME